MRKSSLEDPTTVVIAGDIVKKNTKASKNEALSKKGSTLLNKAEGEEEETMQAETRGKFVFPSSISSYELVHLSPGGVEAESKGGRSLQGGVNCPTTRTCCCWATLPPLPRRSAHTPGSVAHPPSPSRPRLS